MSHRAAVAALVLQGPLCVDCLAHKCGLSVVMLESELTRIGRVIVLLRDTGPCRTCGATVSVVSISR